MVTLCCAVRGGTPRPLSLLRESPDPGSPAGLHWLWDNEQRPVFEADDAKVDQRKVAPQQQAQQQQQRQQQPKQQQPGHPTAKAAAAARRRGELSEDEQVVADWMQAVHQRNQGGNAGTVPTAAMGAGSRSEAAASRRSRRLKQSYSEHAACLLLA
jgi:outer membrane biosynthesis protein TonB